jgi:hypothetical protein
MNELAKVLLQVYEEKFDKGYVEEKRQELENANKYEIWHLAARLNDDALLNFTGLLANRIQIDGGAEAIRNAIRIWRKLDFEVDLTSRPYTRTKLV